MITVSTALACLLAYGLGARDGKLEIHGAVLAAVAGVIMTMLAGALAGII